jgi:TM2 domain-containing membrane protein YozV
MSFGKKGVVPGAQPAPVAARPAPRAATPARPATPVDPYAAQREAFLAAERERRRENGEEEHEYDYSAAAHVPQRPRSSGKSSGYVLGAPEGRNLILAYVFWYFCSPLGMHRIYCGQKDTGFMQMGLFFGGLVIGALIWTPIGLIMIGAWLVWIIVDLFLIPGMMRRFKAEHRTDYRGVFA